MEIEKVTKLANLNLNTQELEKYSSELSEVIDFNMRILNKAEVKDIKPTFQSINLINVTAIDDPRPSLESADILANTRSLKDNLFKVEAVLP